MSGVLRILDLPEEVRQKVGYTRRPLSVDALTRIARVEDADLQSQLADAVIAGGSQTEIRAQIRQSRRGRMTTGASNGERCFNARHGIVVTVRSATGGLTDEHVVAALREALGAAVKES